MSTSPIFRRCLGVVPAAAVVLLVAFPSVASAHAVFLDTPNGFPPSTVQTLHVYVPDELDDSLYNVKIEMLIPAGWKANSCTGLSTWSCQVGVSLDGGGTGVRWTNDTGTVDDPNEDFYLTVTTPAKAMTSSFATVQYYSDGEIVRWVGAPGSGSPAPQLTVLPPDVTPQTTTPTTVNTARPPVVSPPTSSPTVASDPTKAPGTSSSATTPVAKTAASATPASSSSATSTTSTTPNAPKTTVAGAPSVTSSSSGNRPVGGADNRAVATTLHVQSDNAGVRAFVIGGIVVAGIVGSAIVFFRRRAARH